MRVMVDVVKAFMSKKRPPALSYFMRKYEMTETQALGIINSLARTDVKSQIFIVRAYLDVLRQIAKHPEEIAILDKLCDTTGDIQNHIELAENYQKLGMHAPRWQNFNEVLLYAISHLPPILLNRTSGMERLEILADPLLEKGLTHLMEYIYTSGGIAEPVGITLRETANRLVIALQPFFAPRADLLLPDGHDLLEPVDAVLGGLKQASVAMGRRAGYVDDGPADLQGAHAVDDGQTLDVGPALAHFSRHLGQLGLGHGHVGLVFQLDSLVRVVAESLAAHQAGKHAGGAGGLEGDAGDEALQVRESPYDLHDGWRIAGAGGGLSRR